MKPNPTGNQALDLWIEQNERMQQQIMNTPPKFHPGDRVLWRPDPDTQMTGEIMRAYGPSLWVVRLDGRNGYRSHKPCFEADLEKVEGRP